MPHDCEAAPAVPLHRPGTPGLLERDQLITPAALAEFLSVPVKTLRDWRYTGVGPAGLRVGRHVRYQPAEVRRWLAEDCGTERRTA